MPPKKRQPPAKGNNESPDRSNARAKRKRPGRGSPGSRRVGGRGRGVQQGRGSAVAGRGSNLPPTRPSGGSAAAASSGPPSAAAAGSLVPSITPAAGEGGGGAGGGVLGSAASPEATPTAVETPAKRGSDGRIPSKRGQNGNSKQQPPRGGTSDDSSGGGSVGGGGGDDNGPDQAAAAAASAAPAEGSKVDNTDDEDDICDTNVIAAIEDDEDESSHRSQSSGDGEKKQAAKKKPKKKRKSRAKGGKVWFWDTMSLRKHHSMSRSKVDIPPTYRNDEKIGEWVAMSEETRKEKWKEWAKKKRESKAADILAVERPSDDLKPTNADGSFMSDRRYPSADMYKIVYPKKKTAESRAAVGGRTRSKGLTDEQQEELEYLRKELADSSDDDGGGGGKGGRASTKKVHSTMGTKTAPEQALVNGRKKSNYRKKWTRPTSTAQCRDHNVHRNEETLMNEAANIITMTNPDPYVQLDSSTTYVAVGYSGINPTKRVGGRRSKKDLVLVQKDIIIAAPNIQQAKKIFRAGLKALDRLEKTGKTESDTLKGVFFFDDDRHESDGMPIKEQVEKHYKEHWRNIDTGGIKENSDTNSQMPEHLITGRMSPLSSGAVYQPPLG